jgi:hypothetical protein
MKILFSFAVSILFFTGNVFAQASPDSVELTRLLNEFLAGAGRNDVGVHERFWADDLIYTRGSGQRVGKVEIMKSVRTAPAPKAGDPKTVYTAEDVRIQQYGDAAVVAFRLVGTTDNAGKTTVAKFYNTGTFVKRNGKWQAVAWQATRIPDPVEPARQTAPLVCPPSVVKPG